MPFFTSLAAKIAVPIIILIAGVGVFLWQREGSEKLLRPPREQPLAQVGAPDNPPGIAFISPAADAVPDAVQNQETQITEQPSERPAPSAVPSPSPTVQPPEQKKIPDAATAPKTPEPTVAAPSGPFAFNPAWAEAVVNLYCSYRHSQTGEDIITGSGVIIDPRGIILTNAHVGTDFLFAEWPSPSLYNCLVRAGSPAEGRYRAVLLYIPDAWVVNDVAEVRKGNIHKPYDDKDFPLGTKDYALLYITAPSTSDSYAILPSSFPFLAFYTGSIAPSGSPMYMIGYPGSFLGSIAVMRYLHRIASPTVVDSVRSIKGSSTLDILAFQGIYAGQRGTSGGAVVQRGGELAAVPTFFDKKGEWEDPQGATTADNILNAITVEYISRDLKADTGYSLQEFIARDSPEEISKAFLNNEGQRYRNMYVDAWKSIKIPVPGTY